MHSHLYDIEHASLVEAFSGVLPLVAVPSLLLLTCLLQFNSMHLLSPGYGRSPFTRACTVKAQPLVTHSWARANRVQAHPPVHKPFTGPAGRAGHESWVLSVACHPDGSTFATGSSDAKVKLWDLQTRTCAQTITEHTDQVPTRPCLCQGSRAFPLRVWCTVCVGASADMCACAW